MNKVLLPRLPPPNAEIHKREELEWSANEPTEQATPVETVDKAVH